MRTIVIEEPEVGAASVTFRWRVTPASGLYVRESFDLRLPGGPSPLDVPADVWWTVALICLHNHWPLLRPCRVELPVELPPGERELWLRMLDAAVETLELTKGGDDLERTIEIHDRGPRLEPVRASGGDAVALAFSAGKDSLAHLGLLLELGERPLAVTATSPMPYLLDHAAPLRRTAIETVAAHPAVEHVEVRSNLRECWDNSFPRTLGYEVAVNELTDTMLYLCAAFVVAWARGGGHALLASEAEVQTLSLRDGRVIQHPHFMYSAITQRSLDALLARRGVRHGSLTYPLRARQVRELLWRRYPELRRFQYSCWRHGPGESACSACTDCLTTMLTALEAGVAPTRMGIDVPKLLERMADWEPAGAADDEPQALPGEEVRRALHMALVRQFASLRTRGFAVRLARAEPRLLLRRDRLELMRRYNYLRGRLAPLASGSIGPGYRHAYLALVDERWRRSLEQLFDSQFERASGTADAADLAAAQALIERITAPLEERG